MNPFLAPSRSGSCAPPKSARALARLGLLLAPLALISCAATTGGDPPPASNPAPPPPAPTVTVSAPAAQVATGATAQFSLSVQNAPDPTVTWQVDSISGGNSNLGTITPAGLYQAPTAPPTPPKVTVTAVLATDNSISGSSSITVVASSSGPSLAGVFSWRNDSSISGVNTQEALLSPAAIRNTPSAQFGKLFACPVDGEVSAQPLYAKNVSIGGGGLHNVVFVATEHDSVFAFDADASPCQTLWQISFLNSTNGVTSVPACYTANGVCTDSGTDNDVGSNDITPEIGITGTPVINPATSILYVVSKTKSNSPTGATYSQELHALDITTGREEPFSPVVIHAVTAGGGAGATGQDQVPFDPLRENQSGGLALSEGNVYLPFGSHGDVDPFHGWLLAYNANTLAQVAVFNTTPNSPPSRGGISQSGAAPSIDSSGNLFVVTGLGVFDANSTAAPDTDYAQTLLKLTPNPATGTFAVQNSFTPFNQLVMTSDVQSLGTTGVLLLPDQTSGPPHLAVMSGQPGTLYVINRDALGGFTLGGPDKALQELDLGGPAYGTPLFWQGTLYTTAVGQTLSAYSLSNGVLSAASSTNSPETFAFPAASPVVSSNGTSNGIVWLVDSSGYGGGSPATPAILHAYDATNVGNELYNSSTNSADAAGLAVKFAVPTVANGKVYVGTQGELSVYGLLNATH